MVVAGGGGVENLHVVDQHLDPASAEPAQDRSARAGSEVRGAHAGHVAQGLTERRLLLLQKFVALEDRDRARKLARLALQRTCRDHDLVEAVRVYALSRLAFFGVLVVRAVAVSMSAAMVVRVAAVARVFLAARLRVLRRLRHRRGDRHYRKRRQYTHQGSEPASNPKTLTFHELIPLVIREASIGCAHDGRVTPVDALSTHHNPRRDVARCRGRTCLQAR